MALLSAFLAFLPVAFLPVAFLSVFLALLSVSTFVWKPFCLDTKIMNTMNTTQHNWIMSGFTFGASATLSEVIDLVSGILSHFRSKEIFSRLQFFIFSLAPYLCPTCEVFAISGSQLKLTRKFLIYLCCINTSTASRNETGTAPPNFFF